MRTWNGDVGSIGGIQWVLRCAKDFMIWGGGFLCGELSRPRPVAERRHTNGQGCVVLPDTPQFVIGVGEFETWKRP